MNVFSPTWCATKVFIFASEFHTNPMQTLRFEQKETSKPSICLSKKKLLGLLRGLKPPEVVIGYAVVSKLSNCPFRRIYIRLTCNNFHDKLKLHSNSKEESRWPNAGWCKRPLLGITALFSRARYFTLTVPFLAQMYKLVLVRGRVGVRLR